MILKKKGAIPNIVTAGLDTVGVRMPSHPMTNELLNMLEFPLAAPSANKFGSVSPTTPQHVQEQLGSGVDYILDGGRCKVGLESTIIGFVDQEPVLLRKGGVSVEKIEIVIGAVKVQDVSSSQPLAPGMLTTHYAPKKHLVIGSYSEVADQFPNQSIGCLRFSTPEFNCDPNNQVILSEEEDLNEAAYQLFECLHMMDSMDAEVFCVELVPDIELGKAINDRLRRAAATFAH